jgi:hypothetical protein
MPWIKEIWDCEIKETKVQVRAGSSGLLIAFSRPM